MCTCAIQDSVELHQCQCPMISYKYCRFACIQGHWPSEDVLLYVLWTLNICELEPESSAPYGTVAAEAGGATGSRGHYQRPRALSGALRPRPMCDAISYAVWGTYHVLHACDVILVTTAVLFSSQVKAARGVWWYSVSGNETVYYCCTRRA